MAAQNWSPVGTGLPSAITNVLAVDPVNPRSCTPGRGRLLQEHQRGRQRQLGRHEHRFHTRSDARRSLAIAINPQDTNTLYVGTGGFGVWKSVNGGANWTAMNNGLTDSLVNGLVLDPQRPNVLYAATSSSGFFRSTNGGESWAKFGVGQPPNTSLVKSVGISKTGTCLHLGNERQRRHGSGVRLLDGGDLRSDARAGAATVGGCPAVQSLGAGGCPRDSLRDPHQQRSIDGGRRLHRAASRDRRHLQLPDHRSCDEPADRHTERPGRHSSQRRATDVRHLARPDDGHCTCRSGARLRGREHDGPDGDSCRRQHPAAVVLVQPDPRHRRAGAHAHR